MYARTTYITCPIMSLYLCRSNYVLDPPDSSLGGPILKVTNKDELKEDSDNDDHAKMNKNRYMYI